MKRREFITVLGGAAAWPLAARAQQPDRMRRIGVLMPYLANDLEGQARIGAFQQELQQLGWTIGRNVRVDTWWAGANANDIRQHAEELAALAPDAIQATGSATVGPLLQATRTVPIVFVSVPDPVGAGFVNKLLKQIAPGVTRAAIIRDPAISAGLGQFGAIQAMASSVGVEVSALNVRDAGEIESAVADFARSPNGGLIVTASALANFHRELLANLAARHKLPAVYSARHFVTHGGLLSYGPDRIDPYRRAAAYVDRILKGEKPADLPVQAPTKFELVINLKTAKALGLEIPAIVLARADEVIE